jgi:hypothetical protein
MAIQNISGTINSSFGMSGSLSNGLQAAGDAFLTFDLRPTNPVIIVEDALDYGVLGWSIGDAVAVITLTGPQGEIYKNEDYNSPDIVPATSRFLNKTITLPLDPLENYLNILKGNYTLKISWYNSVLDDYYTFLLTYSYTFEPPTITNTTTSGPYTGVLTSTDTTEYGSNVYNTIRTHRVKYPTQLAVPPADIVSSNAEIQVTPIYTNKWTIQIDTFVEYRNPDTLRIYWDGEGEFTHCVYGGCIGAMYDAIDTMLTTYREAMACNLNNQEAYQKRLVIVNTAWHLLNEAYWNGDTAEADAQAYIIQEQVAYTGGGVCDGSTSTLVTPCPPWTPGGGGGSYTFENGLTEGGGVVKWGGVLTGNTAILQADKSVVISGLSGSDTASFDIQAATGVQLKAGDGGTEGRVLVSNDIVTIGIANLGTPANSRLYEFGTNGIVEAADYSSGYVARSLVAKDYVDTAIAAISANTFENGLTAAAGVVKLGGTITEATDLDFSGNYRFRIRGTSGVNRSTEFIVEQSNVILRSFQDVGWVGSSGKAEFSVSSASAVMAYYSDITLLKRILFGASSMTVTDTVSSKGLENAADYSAQWTDHSLVTKKWVTDNFSPLAGSGTFIGLTDTPSSYSGFGGYFLAVNTGGTAVEFVASSFVPVTGGTFTGQVIISTSTDRPLILKQIGAGSSPGTPEAGTNLLSFQDNDGDEQGYVGIDGSGNITLKTNVSGGNVLLSSDLEVNGNIIVTGTVDGVDILAWKTSYDIKEVNWDAAYGWGDHAGLYQLLDADLTAIAGLGFASISFLKKTAVDTWALDTNIYATEAYVDNLAAVTTYTANSINVVTSDGVTGTVSDVQTLADGNVLQIEEVGGSLGYEARFIFTAVTAFNNLFLYLYYHGGSNHTINVQIYNPTSTLWETVSTYTDQSGFTIIETSLVETAKYISGTNEVQVRIYHVSNGDATHYVEVDYIALRDMPNLGNSGLTDHGQLTGLGDDDHTIYALADGSRGTYYIPYGTRASGVDAGTQGETTHDDDYMYVCVVGGAIGVAVWKRIPLTVT